MVLLSATTLTDGKKLFASRITNKLFEIKRIKRKNNA